MFHGLSNEKQLTIDKGRMHAEEEHRRVNKCSFRGALDKWFGDLGISDFATKDVVSQLNLGKVSYPGAFLVHDDK